MRFLDTASFLAAWGGLRSIEPGKTNLERLNSLSYWMAIDRVLRIQNESQLDLNPRSLEGEVNRNLLRIEFASISELCRHAGASVVWKIPGVSAEVVVDAAKRISSNFLTTPVKRASASGPSKWPRRPQGKALVELGLGADCWTLASSENAVCNIPAYLSHCRGKRVALVHYLMTVFSQAEFLAGETLRGFLCRCVIEHHTESVGDYVCSVLNKQLKASIDDFQFGLVDSRPDFFQAIKNDKRPGGDDYVAYLEALLRSNNISF
jgi:hypothetical protein